MTTEPVPAVGTTVGAAKGPASYFPSIEKKHARPITQRNDLTRSSPRTKHMELVSWLKTEHGLGGFVHLQQQRLLTSTAR
ncbi:hypothetical protein SSP35_14_00790 [Streptomyces sp. NBRC 110611]|uniref:DUF4287 domain-containing protein n=1 Tax=Streptomyces sp. NBRC 110611 TaxID=1621259 RepID=UPI000858ACF7|nr:DUF4287 domain-containing protein [Streptomyces sp. NBRC 110611]GAU69745.1 hypothetical protein SSP35_14_00790 [Streptomyces sp. NBRC 110611]